jgi:hypothetical protein
MLALIHQRCFIHGQREAAVRCPECQRFFCRECVTEHDDRLLCASCLKKTLAGPAASRARLRVLVRLAACAGGFFVAWMFFYFMGRTLLSIPTSFHEGTLWADTSDDK